MCSGDRCRDVCVAGVDWSADGRPEGELRTELTVSEVQTRLQPVLHPHSE